MKTTFSTLSMQVREGPQIMNKSSEGSAQAKGTKVHQDRGIDGLMIYIGVASPIALLLLIVWFLLKYECQRVERMIAFIKERRTSNNRSL